MTGLRASRLGRLSWTMFDWANQPFYTLIMTFVFGVYFADVFITGDISHRYLLKGDEMNLGLVQVNHLSTEIPGMKRFVHNLSIELGTKLEYFYNKYYE